MIEYLILLLAGSAFIKITTVISIFQYGLGLRDFSFNIVTFILSLVLTLFVMQPVWEEAIPSWNEKTKSIESLSHFKDRITPFLEQHTEADQLSSLQKITEKYPKPVDPFVVKLTAFVLSSLKIAFMFGLAIIIPFILIDLLVINVLMALNVTQISALTISVPCKLLIFYLCNGWELLANKLLNFY